MLSDLAIDTLSSALHGISARQRAIADNIANVGTPRYLARRVAFEDNLRRALNSGEAPRSATVSETRSLDPTRDDGNNVNLDDEVVSGAETNLRYQLTINAINQKFHILRTAIREGH